MEFKESAEEFAEELAELRLEDAEASLLRSSDDRLEEEEEVEVDLNDDEEALKEVSIPSSELECAATSQLAQNWHEALQPLLLLF